MKRTPTERRRAAEQQVTAQLGVGYRVVCLNGYWVIGHTDAPSGWRRVSPDPLRKSLARAIADVKGLDF